MKLNDIRNEIDRIDNQIIELFTKRMNCSKKVAEYKLENRLPVCNPERENDILDSVEAKAGEYGPSARQLYATIMELSRALQHNMLDSGESLRNRILCAEKHIPFDDDSLKIACFGVPGTYANRASNKIFHNSTPDFYPTFQEVFSAIQSGEADFGVVPIENSSAGSVSDVYDLMLKYRFYIAASTEISVNHCLAALPGTKLESIKAVYSHPQALSQCSDYIRSKNFIQKEYISTAAAAQMVSESDSYTIASICSEEAAQKYGLEIISKGFQNTPNNTTRFIVISKKLYIGENADKISLCFSLPHTTGSLYSVLCRFAANGLNLTKIESRPMLDRTFEYLFYLDFTGTVNSRNTLSLLCALSDELTEFSFLGNSETII